VRYSGFGTQRIEDELQALFPAARILRMDADTTAGKFSHQKLFDAFAAHEYDILVGTQMVAKGLDFDDVTLVGVVNADNALYDENYLSHERAFDLITQVVGRSGRRDATGTAVIQTIDPCNPVIDLAARQDYPAFFETEYALRRILTYPPFCDIYGVFFVSEDENAAALAAKAFFDTLVLENKEQQQKLIVLGPSPARISKISNTYRYRLAIKCKNSKSVRNLLMQVLKATVKMKELRKVQISIDLNPIDLG
jgi:primosomal protein N' (replication factor Y)